MVIFFMNEDRYDYGYEMPLNAPTMPVPVIIDTLNGKQYYSLRQVVDLLNVKENEIRVLKAKREDLGKTSLNLRDYVETDGKGSMVKVKLLDYVDDLICERLNKKLENDSDENE